MRPVRNSCEKMVSDCTTKSMFAKTSVRRVVSEKVSDTMRSCSKYRKVLTAESSVTNSAMPSR